MAIDKKRYASSVEVIFMQNVKHNSNYATNFHSASNLTSENSKPVETGMNNLI
jgi:hypothetical protein